MTIRKDCPKCEQTVEIRTTGWGRSLGYACLNCNFWASNYSRKWN